MSSAQDRLPGRGEMAALVQAHDWSKTPLGPPEAWPDELGTIVKLLLGQDFPMVLLWGPDLIQIYNDGYRDILAEKHPAGLGRPTREVWPEVWAFNAPIYERVLAGETVTLTDQLFPITRRGAAEDAWFSLCYSPVRLAADGVGGIFISIHETTGRIRREAVQAEREQRYQTLFNSIDDGFGIIEMIFDTAQNPVDYRFIDANPAFARHTGIADPVGRTAREAVPGLEQFWFETYGRVATSREPTKFQQGAGPLGKWFDVYAFPVGEADQRRVGLLFNDVTDSKRAGEALRTGEERLRLIVENARDYAIFTTDTDGIIDDWYKGAEHVFGWTRDEAVGQPAEITFTQEDRAEGVPLKERLLAAEEGAAPDVRWHVRKGGTRVFIDGIATPLRDSSGAVTRFLKIGRDSTERHAADQRQRTLLAELQHRVRNTLAVVRSIARRTADTSDTVDDMSSHLQGRLDAFARVQAVVTRNPEKGVDLASLIEDELLAHAAREGEQLRIEGPDICLLARPAESLSLAVHELTTNAVKYGALGSERGRLAVEWQRSAGDGAEWLTLVWTESELDRPVEPPQRQGFGLELLQRTLPYDLRARTEVEFRPEGLRFTLTMPVGAGVEAPASD